MIDRELSRRSAAILVVVALLLSRLPMGFIDAKPRELGIREAGAFIDEVTSGAFFEIPTL